jgi:hypothetical protein
MRGPQTDDKDIRGKRVGRQWLNAPKRKQPLYQKGVTRLWLKNKKTNQTYRRKQAAFLGELAGETELAENKQQCELPALGTALTSCGYAQGDGGRTEGPIKNLAKEELEAERWPLFIELALEHKRR